MLRPIHLIYAVALLGSYASLYGVNGLYVGAIVLFFWGLVFYSSNRPKTLFTVAIFAVIGACLYGLLMPVPLEVRQAARRSGCKNNLKQILLALHNYHETHESFPPAYVTDDTGKPLYSWRVMLLPHLGEQDLYNKYDLNKAWDSPENLPFLHQMPIVYACPSHVAAGEKSECTSYVAVVDSKTSWPGAKSTTFRDIRDGADATIMVIESDTPQIPWTAPRDLTLDQAVSQLATTEMESFGGHRSGDFLRPIFHGHSVAFADGSVHFAPFGLGREVAKGLLLIDDGQPESNFDLSRASQEPRSKIKWENVILLTIFLVLNVLPLPWVWWNPSGVSRKAKLAESKTGDAEGAVNGGAQ